MPVSCLNGKYGFAQNSQKINFLSQNILTSASLSVMAIKTYFLESVNITESAEDC